nr:MAG TPA: hypothetical protein [Microviridae sp.]
MSWFLQGQRKALFSNKQNISEFFILRLGCELCVYRRGGGEFERITRICFAHN